MIFKQVGIKGWCKGLHPYHFKPLDLILSIEMCSDPDLRIKINEGAAGYG